MNKKIICLILSIFCFCTFLSAENQVKYPKSAFGFEIYQGLDSGVIGLTYQEWFDNNWGFQGTAGAIKDDAFLYSIELQLQRLFKVDQYNNRISTALFGWTNAALVSVQSENYNDETEVYEITTSPGLLLGVGFGIEMTFFEHISVPFRFGINGQLLSNPGMNIGFGVGILYRF